VTRHDEQPEILAAGKGRATPKRSEVERKRRRPVAAPSLGKEAARLERIRMNEQRQKVRQAWRTGDEKDMPARDRGPARRFVRDSIDSRLTITEWFVPVAILLYIGQFNDKTIVPAGIGMMVLTFLVIIELTVVGFQLRSQLKRKFPNEARRGALIRYGLIRTAQLRRIRLPRPMVKRFSHTD